ncbi:MAG TPA: HyaD/HybD family hydrogenase maturation endopeptidase [Steroidobacteraceae bacterium]|nr:HyaD/HybD family hydrogenase maturation endopeptidase [Steroidobacteraceae bacterium]
MLPLQNIEPAYATLVQAPPVVLGFGNVLLGDDGAGVHAVERLRRELGSDAINCVDAGTMSFSLLPLVEAAPSMLVIDAACLGAPAGTVALYEGEAMDSFLRSARRRTVHELGLNDLLDMSRLRDTLPPLRALLCIQPQRIDWGQELSAPVARGLDSVVQQASQLLQRWRH